MDFGHITYVYHEPPVTSALRIGAGDVGAGYADLTGVASPEAGDLPLGSLTSTPSSRTTAERIREVLARGIHSQPEEY